VLSEAFYLLGRAGRAPLAKLLERRALILGFALGEHIEPVLKLLQKYSDVPMSLADACLVRMTETSGDSVLLTTDRDFRAHRRHGRQVIPCVLPSCPLIGIELQRASLSATPHGRRGPRILLFLSNQGGKWGATAREIPAPCQGHTSEVDEILAAILGEIPGFLLGSVSST